MSIYDEVLHFIRSPWRPSFEQLALAVFHYQFEHVPPYRQYCLDCGVKAEKVKYLAEIPPVSTLAFKYAKLASRAEPVTPAACLFLTSGTTIGRNQRGRHLVLRPEIYRASATGHLKAMLFPDGRRTAMLALHPTADRMPESSLSRMISWCIEEFGTGEAFCAATRQGVDTMAAMEFMRADACRTHPLSLLGTTASFAALFAQIRAQIDAHDAPIRLAGGSRLMDTGGAKGQTIPLTPHQVAAMAEELLGIAAPLVINEYGMTEMCSQLYDATSFNSATDAPPGFRMKAAPPWLRAVAVDPVNLAPVADGCVGMLSYFDLANVGSVSALLTEDFGMVQGGAVAIIGRAAAGDPRGCALAIEQFAAHRSASA
ncbi:MAG: hypothetical protein ACREQN_06055 [Candidatus Binataceae bacterium]